MSETVAVPPTLNSTLKRFTVQSVFRTMTTQTKQEQHHETLQKALEQFKDQYGVELQATGYEMTANENGGIHEEEYWVKGLVTSNIENLDFRTGGWFSIDTRGEEDEPPTIYAKIGLEMNGDPLKQNKVISIRYRPEKEKWSELRWESL